jgi:uncharacterized protein (UPF0335 family)
MTSFHGGVSSDQLRTVIERVERLEEEKKNIAEDIKQVYAEAKSGGFDVKTIREVVRMRKIESSELEEREFLLDTYRRALGMLPEVEDAA